MVELLVGPGREGIEGQRPRAGGGEGDSVREPTRLFDVVIDDFRGGAPRGAITRATVVIVDDD